MIRLIILFSFFLCLSSCKKEPEKEQSEYLGSYSGHTFQYCDGTQIDATQHGYNLTITESSWIENGISHPYQKNGDYFIVDYGVSGVSSIKMHSSGNLKWFIEDDYCNVSTNFYLKYSK